MPRAHPILKACIPGGPPLTSSCAVLASGASKRLKGVAAALRRRVDQYFPPVEGVYPPPEDTVLLDKLTDELLVVALDTVAASAAAYRASIEGLQDVPVFSGKAQLRLLVLLTYTQRPHAALAIQLAYASSPPCVPLHACTMLRLQLVCYILHPTSYILHPTSYSLYPISYIQHPTSYNLYHTSDIIHHTSDIFPSYII